MASKTVALVRTSCVLCRKRHRRCDGQLPCSICSEHGSECIYENPKRPGRKPTKQEKEVKLTKRTVAVDTQLGTSWTTTYLRYLDELSKEWSLVSITLPELDIIWRRPSIAEMTIADQERLFLVYSALALGASMARLSKAIRDGADDKLLRGHLNDFLQMTESSYKNICEQPIASPMRVTALTILTTVYHIDNQVVRCSTTALATQRALVALISQNSNVLNNVLVRWLLSRTYLIVMKTSKDRQERFFWFNKAAMCDSEFPLLKVNKLCSFVMAELQDNCYQNPDDKMALSSYINEAEQLIQAHFIKGDFETPTVSTWKTNEFYILTCKALMCYNDAQYDEAFSLNKAAIQNLTSRSRLPTVSTIYYFLASLCEINEAYCAKDKVLVREYLRLFETFSSYYGTPLYAVSAIERIQLLLLSSSQNDEQSVASVPALTFVDPDENPSNTKSPLESFFTGEFDVDSWHFSENFFSKVDGDMTGTDVFFQAGANLDSTEQSQSP